MFSIAVIDVTMSQRKGVRVIEDCMLSIKLTFYSQPKRLVD